ncbi:MAG TPA: sensor domain-containing diguanylate cyclase [bacterium]|nr:sensor domain-containing diguanylate cyclase [bacterium]
MRTFRNTFFFFVVLYVFALTISYSKGKEFSANFYFFSLSIIVSLLIVIEIIYAFNVSMDIHKYRREKEKMQLNIIDAELESVLLSTLTDIIETFEENITLDEILETITESLRNIFKKETIILQLLGDNFKKSLKGQDIDFSEELFEQVVGKSRPVLVNNTSSFAQYKQLEKQGVTSFIISPFHQKRNVIGILGIFSFDHKQFNINELNLLRKVSAPTSLLVENAVLFDRTKILAITDSLTQLYNRRHFEQRLNTIIFDAEKQGKKVSLCIADVDFFKFYNDTNGHQAGDVVLKKIAEVLKQGVKGSDVVGRYGGEEFIIIFPDTDKNSAVRICNTIRKKIKDYKFHNEENQPQNDLTISFGVASYPDDAKTPEQLIKQADFSLYRAKEAGKDRVIS